MEPQTFDTWVRAHRLPPEVDAVDLRREALALRPPYRIAGRHLPLPVWARRPLADSAAAAWRVLRRDVPAIDAARPFCIYVHLPFCPERCAFCDCYSFRLGRHRQRHVDGYLALLAQEMALWSGLGTLARRPVSTLHLGGGTPTFLGEEALARLVDLLRAHFALEAATELALESTAAELTPAMLAHLHGLGFRRLHVGVQSLDEGQRRALNRRAPAADVLAALGRAVAAGWVVSVDLIYGLPGQRLDGLLDDVWALIAAGVDGFSLYELQISSRNRRWAARHGLLDRDREENYLLAQVAGRYLAVRGYRKTLFNHFAGAHDTNLYFTFPERGEDLLALGTIADGVFGDYHYRHPEYAAYRRGVGDDAPGLAGGLRRTARENRLQPLVTALMAGRVPAPLLEALAGDGLGEAWLASRLLAPGPGGDYWLTGNGSWFVGNMISELTAQPTTPEAL
jgi:coproporphyrinogen III oxidase-like Fe-S oxidoreductase